MLSLCDSGHTVVSVFQLELQSWNCSPTVFFTPKPPWDAVAPPTKEKLKSL